MEVLVEFFGIPRRRAGIAQMKLKYDSDTVTLGTVLQDLSKRCPGLSEDCLRDGRILPGMVVNLSGERFVVDPLTTIRAAESILIMSADVGG